MTGPRSPTCAAWALLVLLGLWAGQPRPAAAEQLVLSVSQPHVLISSSFTGADLVLFGVIEDTGGAQARGYDIVVTVRGPRRSFVTWRKSQVLGLWINTQSRTFLDAPAFLSVSTNRPADEIAPPVTLRREQIGLSRQVLVQRIGADYADVVPEDPFRTAFLRMRQGERLYQDAPAGVTFLSPTAFRAEVPIPGRAPIGRYEVSVLALKGGEVAARAETAFEVQKGGFEQQVTNFARNFSVFYGLAVAAGSLLIGFAGNLLFRRE